MAITRKDLLVLLERHCARLERRVKHRVRVSRRYSYARLTVFSAGALLSYLVFQLWNPVAGELTVTLFLLVFILLVRIHDAVEKSLSRYRIWLRLKRMHIARMTLAWEELPLTSSGVNTKDHPFAQDLNLIGARSLHHLLDTTTTEGGSGRLLGWLLDTHPDLPQTVTRQELVRDLQHRSIFRDKLTLLGAQSRAVADPRWSENHLIHWLKRETAPSLRTRLYILGSLALLNILLFIGHVFGIIPAVWPFTLFLYLALYITRYQSLRDLFTETHNIQQALEQISSPLRFLESYPFHEQSKPALLCKPLRDKESRPGHHLRRVERIATAAALTKSELLWLVFNIIIPWELLFTVLLDQAKHHLRHLLPQWLNIWYEMEALCALATFADINPLYTFPLLDEPVFKADSLGHPLIPEERKVRNSFELHQVGEIVLVTGSNMSGKSTFLRTLGINLRLALAGGPVDAAQLQTIPFRLFTCMNVSDSVQDGLSYFYAEVQRLKALLEAVKAKSPYPSLFLIDEIFRGTNNRERLIGSRAYVKALAEERGTGLIATHDLELVHLEDEITHLRNMHFREDVTNGKMTFDYHLRPGPCPTTNALVIMRLEGLPVEQ